VSVTYDKSWFSPGLPVSSINKTDRHDITEILLKVALNTINQSTCTAFIPWVRVRVIVFNATVNNISVILVEETGGSGENHRPTASHWQTIHQHMSLCSIYLIYLFFLNWCDISYIGKCQYCLLCKLNTVQV